MMMPRVESRSFHHMRVWQDDAQRNWPNDDPTACITADLACAPPQSSSRTARARSPDLSACCSDPMPRTDLAYPPPPPPPPPSSSSSSQPSSSSSAPASAAAAAPAKTSPGLQGPKSVERSRNPASVWRYSVCGTEPAFWTTRESVWCYCVCGTEAAYGATACVVLWYSVFGTEAAYGARRHHHDSLRTNAHVGPTLSCYVLATRSPVLRQRCLVPQVGQYALTHAQKLAGGRAACALPMRCPVLTLRIPVLNWRSVLQSPVVT
eukprot:3535963-Rhodomonas_salina.2